MEDYPPSAAVHRRVSAPTQCGDLRSPRDARRTDANLARISQRLLADVRARKVDVIVVYKVDRLTRSLADPAAVLQAAQHAASDAGTQKRLVEAARHFAAGEHEPGAQRLRTFVHATIVRVQVHVDRVDITLDQDQVLRCLDETGESEPIYKTQSEVDRQMTTLSIPARLKRTGKELRIIVDDGSEPATADTGLVRLLLRANTIRAKLLADRSLTFEDIAKSEGVVPSYATRLFRLTLLAPDIVSAILSGRHPPELTARRLMDDTRLPLDWNEQRHRLGFSSAHSEYSLRASI